MSTQHDEKPIQEKKVFVTKKVQVINCRQVNIRVKPTKEAPVVKVVPKGTILNLIGYHNGEKQTWAKVYVDSDAQDSKNARGYIMGEYVREE